MIATCTRKDAHGYGAPDAFGVVVDLHDCDHVARIDRLVPRAERMADEEVRVMLLTRSTPIPLPEMGPDETMHGYLLRLDSYEVANGLVRTSHRWNRAYHQAMGSLCREAGLRTF